MNNAKEIICIVCPRGCRLTVDGSDQNNLLISGNRCNRGPLYAVEELTSPKRMVTSTVKITGALHKRLPVKTSRPIPKDKVADAVRQLDSLSIVSPVKCGDVVWENILGTGADVIATRDL